MQKKSSNIHCFENCSVEKIEQTRNNIIVHSKNVKITSKIVIGADGAHSIVQKQLGTVNIDKEHYSAGLRVYYEGVTGFHDDNLIELHFFKEVIPGYLWLFPLAGNKANVGIGMLSSVISKKRVNLKEVLDKLLVTHPHLKSRFKNARPLETVKGFGLPLGSKRRNISGEKYLLVGDAASLIDPFSGEGVANAIRSGRTAAKHVMACVKANDFSAGFNKAYDEEIYRLMGKEFRISKLLQKLITYPWLCNLIVKKANSAKYIKQALIEALANFDKRKSFIMKPKFYFNLLFPGKNKRA